MWSCEIYCPCLSRSLFTWRCRRQGGNSGGNWFYCLGLSGADADLLSGSRGCWANIFLWLLLLFYSFALANLPGPALRWLRLCFDGTINRWRGAKHRPWVFYHLRLWWRIDCRGTIWQSIPFHSFKLPKNRFIAKHDTPLQLSCGITLVSTPPTPETSWPAAADPPAIVARWWWKISTCPHLKTPIK